MTVYDLLGHSVKVRQKTVSASIKIPLSAIQEHYEEEQHVQCIYANFYGLNSAPIYIHIDFQTLFFDIILIHYKIIFTTPCFH